jgi:hypothetical protein
MGADAWRRIGILTFDGNRKVKEKIYTRIHPRTTAGVYEKKFPMA